MKKFVLLLLLPLLSFTALHKFYVSSTDIEYNEKNRSLQIISHVFVDDLEDLLKARYNKELYLVQGKEHPQADEYVEKYFQTKLKIRVNGKERKLNYIGKEYDKDQLLVYIEVEDVEPIKTASVENSILTDLFPEQKNVIKFENKGEIKSLLLSQGMERGSLNFNK